MLTEAQLTGCAPFVKCRHNNFTHSIFHFVLLQCRTNVLLIGDSMGDPKMINGLQTVDNVIRIGFLNAKVILPASCTKR